MLPTQALVIAVLQAFVVSWLLLFVLLRSGLAYCVLDRPNSRSLHSIPTPRIGGLAVLAGALSATISHDAAWDWWWPAAPLLAVSFLDDLRSVSALLRLMIHGGIAALVVWGHFDISQPWVGAVLVAVLVWSMNLYNFMDGSDGLAGGMTFFGFLGLAAGAGAGGYESQAIVYAAMAAAALAFLCFNFPPARVFMGDGGSVPLGFMAATAGLEGWISGVWPWWFPLLVFAPFLLDATCTLLKRLSRGERIWQAHREHYYQRLIRLGWSHRRTAIVYYSLMILFGSAAFGGLFLPPVGQLALLALMAAIGLFLMLAVDRLWSRAETVERNA